MKKNQVVSLSILFSLFFLVQSIKGQVKIGIYTGYSLSSFEAQDGSSDMLPIGFQAYYSLENAGVANFNFGLDFNYSVVPFSFEMTTNSGTVLFTRKQKQLYMGALIKIKFLNASLFNPYVRLGMGLYSGGHSLEYPDAIKQEAQQKQVSLPAELDISSGFGFNFGAGLDYKLTETTGIFTEFVYHINSREINESPLNVFQGLNLQKSSLGFNNWAILVGFQAGFKF